MDAQLNQQLALTNHDRFDVPLPPPAAKPPVAKPSYSYFERYHEDREEPREFK